MQGFRDYPLKSGGIEIKHNVKLIVRERGKLVKRHCREEHNVFVDEGRKYLARVGAPKAGFADHYAEPPREFFEWMQLGIGGDSQSHPNAYAAPLNNAHGAATPGYPPGTAQGAVGNLQDDTDQTITQLERPVLITDLGVKEWGTQVNTPVTFLSSDRTLRLQCDFALADINIIGVHTYPIVPVSEVGLCLSTQTRTGALTVYDDANPPTMIGPQRQIVCAYNTFEPIPITTSFALEIWWELRYA